MNNLDPKYCGYCHTRYCFPSHVYIIDGRSDGALKIGYAVRPSQRAAKLRKSLGERGLFVLRSFETGCSFRSMRIEAASHEAVWRTWSGRGEWFYCTADEAERAIRRNMATFPMREGK